METVSRSFSCTSLSTDVLLVLHSWRCRYYRHIHSALYSFVCQVTRASLMSLRCPFKVPAPAASFTATPILVCSLRMRMSCLRDAGCCSCRVHSWCPVLPTSGCLSMVVYCSTNRTVESRLHAYLHTHQASRGERSCGSLRMLRKARLSPTGSEGGSQW